MNKYFDKSGLMFLCSYIKKMIRIKSNGDTALNSATGRLVLTSDTDDGIGYMYFQEGDGSKGEIAYFDSENDRIFFGGGGGNTSTTNLRGTNVRLYHHGNGVINIGNSDSSSTVTSVKTPISETEDVYLIHVDKSARVMSVGAGWTEDVHLKCRGSAFQAYTSGGDVIMQAGDGGNVRLVAGDGGSVYLGYGSTVVVSDENFKTMITLDGRYLTFARAIIPSGYIYKEHTRVHVGFGAQTIEKALLASGLTAEEFAGLVIERDVKEYGDDGEVIAVHDVRYGLRYEEFIALVMLVQQADAERIGILETQMNSIMSRLEGEENE